MSFSCWVCCCILSKFYIKPQHRSRRRQQLQVVSYRNSTSNHNLSLLYYKENRVVSYRNSTSNHNQPGDQHSGGRVVSYRNSTSNHNFQHAKGTVSALYLIEILHQTTTVSRTTSANPVLYLIEILHQTTTQRSSSFFGLSLYLIEILHQTTTHLRELIACASCILSKFYIKPQLVRNYYGYSQVVSYRNSTSNHNKVRIKLLSFVPLYLIEILHQTTTVGPHID